MSGIIVFILRIILALILLGFFGWALTALWRDLQLRTQLVAPRVPPTLQLRIHLEGQVFDEEITTMQAVVGRDPASDLLIQHDTVSARHLRFSHHHGQWWVEDLQSTNGTLMHDERVLVPTIITTGDEILCGEVGIQVLGSRKKAPKVEGQ